MVERYNISGFHTLVNTNDGYLVKYTDYHKLETAARNLVNHAKDAPQELWASLPDVIALREALEGKEV